jgi:hypothetical protein
MNRAYISQAAKGDSVKVKGYRFGDKIYIREEYDEYMFRF